MPQQVGRQTELGPVMSSAGAEAVPGAAAPLTSKILELITCIQMGFFCFVFWGVFFGICLEFSYVFLFLSFFSFFFRNFGLNILRVLHF